MGKPYRRPTPWAKWLKRGMMYNLLFFFSLPETSSTKHTHTHLVLKWRQGRWMRAYVVGQMLGARCMFHNLIGIKEPMITSTNVNLHHEPSTLLSPLYRRGSEVLNNLPVITQLEMEWAEPPGLARTLLSMPYSLCSHRAVNRPHKICSALWEKKETDNSHQCRLKCE